MYPATQNCLTACSKLPQGALTDTGGQTVGCRLYHAGAAAGAGAPVHCPHAGPAGEGVCSASNCESFCIIAQQVCTGTNQIFADTATCMSQCGSFNPVPTYNATIMAGNTFACRMYHLMAATLSPVGHCPHIALNSATCQ